MDCDEKVVGLICDDMLYLKITEPRKLFMGEDYQEGAAYQGARQAMMIDKIYNSKWLGRLVCLATDHLAITKQDRGKKGET